MAYKFCRPNAGATYTQLDTLKGEVNLVVSNGTGVVVRFVGPAANITEANALETSGLYIQMPSVAQAVYPMIVDPSQTWIKAETGGGNLVAHFNW
jgi:hypothetical protein